LPANDAVSRGTPAPLPPDWTDYRRQWEIGRALAATLAAIGLVAAVREWLIERDQGAAWLTWPHSSVLPIGGLHAGPP